MGLGQEASPSHLRLMKKSCFLAHQVVVSTGITHLREFYLTYPILTHGRDKKKKEQPSRRKTSDIIVMLKLSHHVMLHLNITGKFWEPFFKCESTVFGGEQVKESIICVRMG